MKLKNVIRRLENYSVSRYILEDRNSLDISIGVLKGLENLIQEIESWYNANNTNLSDYQFSFLMDIIERSFGSSIVNDLKESCDGKWIGRECGRCSECGHEGCGSDIFSGCDNNGYGYCPNCGKKLKL